MKTLIRLSLISICWLLLATSAPAQVPVAPMPAYGYSNPNAYAGYNYRRYYGPRVAYYPPRYYAPRNYGPRYYGGYYGGGPYRRGW